MSTLTREKIDNLRREFSIYLQVAVRNAQIQQASQNDLNALCDAALAGLEQWIPVGERLPERGALVCVWCSSYYQGKGGLDQAMLGVGDGEWRNLRFRQSLDVTHWMPLPQPPESR